MVNKFIEKVIRKLRKYWVRIYSALYKPAAIFVFHQTGEVFNPLVDYAPIWSSMDLYKQNIETIRKNYKIISLEKAVKLMLHPIVLKRYAVITFDDGYQSTLNAIEYLIENKIPCTWFINTAYLDQESFSIVNADIYLNHSKNKQQDLINLIEKTKSRITEEEYFNMEKEILAKTDMSPVISEIYVSREKLFSMNSKYLSIGMHGHQHWDSRNLSLKTFIENIQKNLELLKSHPCFVSYFALPYGAYNKEQEDYLIQKRVITLLCDNDLIHTKYPLLSRCCLDGIDFKTVKRI